jgi:integrase
VGGRGVASVRKAIGRAATAAGLDGVSPHVLRHTAVSWAMQNGRINPSLGGDG